MTPINSKLINLLNSFSPNEIKELKKFISSGLYTSGRNYLPLLNHLIKYKSKGLDNIYAKDIYSKLYPGKKFSKQTLKNRFSELYKLGEEFLIYSGLKENKIEKDKFLLKMLIKKKLHNAFESKYKKVIEAMDTERYDDDKYNNLLIMKDLNMIFLTDRKKVVALYNQYHEVSQIRLCTYLIGLFEIGFEFGVQEYDNRKYEYNHVVDFLRTMNVSDLMKTFSKSDVLIYKVTAMNYYLFKAYEIANKEEYYFRSHKMFTELSPYLKEDYRLSKFNQFIQYSIKKQNEGIKKFQLELFNLYNEKLGQGLYSDLRNKIYLSNNFRDYVFIGIAIKKYKWVEEFLQKYSPELPEEFREDEINLTYAKLNIEHKHYEKSLLNLNKINTNNYLLYMDSSVLKLCCYYELGLYEEAFLELDKLRHYIRNHKEIPKVHRNFNIKFVQIYQKLLRLTTDLPRKDIGFLEKEINSSRILVKKDWLLEKVFEINS